MQIKVVREGRALYVSVCVCAVIHVDKIIASKEASEV